MVLSVCLYVLIAYNICMQIIYVYYIFYGSIYILQISATKLFSSKTTKMRHGGERLTMAMKWFQNWLKGPMSSWLGGGGAVEAFRHRIHHDSAAARKRADHALHQQWQRRGRRSAHPARAGNGAGWRGDFLVCMKRREE